MLYAHGERVCQKTYIFFLQWKAVLSLGFNIVCLYCMIRKLMFGWVAVLIDMFLMKDFDYFICIKDFVIAHFVHELGIQ